MGIHHCNTKSIKSLGLKVPILLATTEVKADRMVLAKILKENEYYVEKISTVIKPKETSSLWTMYENAKRKVARIKDSRRDPIMCFHHPEQCRNIKEDIIS